MFCMFEVFILTDSVRRFPAPGIMPTSFTPDSGGKEPEQKRAAILCKFFAQGWCYKGKSCKFLHVKENSNGTSQQQAANNMAGSSVIQSNEGMLYNEIIILLKIVILVILLVGSSNNIRVR